MLEHYGAEAEWIPVTHGQNDGANDALVADMVNQMAAIFIDDGHPHRIVGHLRNDDGTGICCFMSFLNPTDDILIDNSNKQTV